MIKLEAELTTKLVEKLIEDHNTDRYSKLRKYYQGRSDIVDRTMKDSEKPNNKLVNPYSSYIVDVMAGYFLGIPVAYSSGNDDLMAEIQEIFDVNEEQSHNTTLAHEMGILGQACEILWANEKAMPEFANVPMENIIAVYDTSIKPKLRFVIRPHEVKDLLNDKTHVYAEVYTSDSVIYYAGARSQDRNIKLELVEEVPHFFDEVPVVFYNNNDDLTGDFEKVVTLIDAYDKAQSDTANDFEYFADAYLALIGLAGTDGDDIKAMKENRVLLLDEKGQAEWVVKTQEYLATQEFKDRLKADIHKFAMVPDLTDEKFGANLSGISLQYKLWGMEQAVSSKERNFTRALMRRIKLITNFLSYKGQNFDANEIDIQFTRNVPANLKEMAEVVQTLLGIVSKQTLLGLLPMIDNVAQEQGRIEAESIDNVDLDQYLTENLLDGEGSDD